MPGGGADVTAEASALRTPVEALKRSQADRLATLNQISRHAKTCSRPDDAGRVI
jgi:hypothetical protein